MILMRIPIIPRLVQILEIAAIIPGEVMLGIIMVLLQLTLLQLQLYLKEEMLMATIMVVVALMHMDNQ